MTVLALALAGTAACTNPENTEGGAVEDPATKRGDGPWMGNMGPSSSCKSDGDYVPYPGASPRLTARQFNNTVRALFPGINIPTQDFPTEGATGASFDNDSAAQTSSASLIEAHQKAAETIAQLAVAQMTSVLPCKAGSPAEEASCGKTFVSNFLERAWRRPPAGDELSATTSFFDSMRTKYGFSLAVQMTIEAVLQTPDFLYLVHPSARAGSTAPLTPFETASRLSYFLWDTVPDDELYKTAKDNSISDMATLEKQARRLMDDPRAKQAVANFHRQWLGLDRIDTADKDPQMFSAFSAGKTNVSMRGSVERYLDYVFWGPGSVSALLTDSTTFVDDALIPVYGLNMPQTGQWQTVAMDENRRSGLLTQAGIMAALARSTTESPTLRGKFMMENLLCVQVPSPPPGVVTALPEQKMDSAPVTLRQRLEQTHVQPQCASCHSIIDGLGLGFQAYDALGQYRSEEAGMPVDTHGEVKGTLDADGPFDGAIELSKRLANSSQVRQCVTAKWLSYALAHVPSSDAACAVQALGKALQSTDNMRELVINIIKSPAFRMTRGE